MKLSGKTKNYLARVALLCSILALSACSGGSDDPAPAPATTNSLVGTWLIDTFDGVAPDHTLTVIHHDDSTFSFREGAPGDPDTFWCTYSGTYSNTNTTITYTDTSFDGNSAGCANDYSNGTPYTHSYTLSGNQLTGTEGTSTYVATKQTQSNYYEVYGAPVGDYSYTTSNRTLIGTSVTGNTFDVTGFDRFIIHIPSTAGKVLFDAFGLDSQWVQSAPGSEFMHYTKSMIATDPSGGIDPDIEGAQDGKTIENVVGEDSYYHFTTFGASTLTVYTIATTNYSIADLAGTWNLNDGIDQSSFTIDNTGTITSSDSPEFVSGSFSIDSIGNVSSTSNWTGFTITMSGAMATDKNSISGSWAESPGTLSGNFTMTKSVSTGSDGTVTSAGQVWMDRNLGASQVATSFDNSAAFGYLYQWGRGADGHENRYSLTTSTLSSSDSPGHGNFILSPSSGPHDWRSPQNDNLWQGVSGTNNPCPAGFRLPTETEWEAERLSWSSNDRAGAFASPLKLVSAGYRGKFMGSVYYTGSDGCYWSSTHDGSDARYLDFTSGSAAVTISGRASGFSVRCYED